MSDNQDLWDGIMKRKMVGAGQVLWETGAFRRHPQTKLDVLYELSFERTG